MRGRILIDCIYNVCLRFDSVSICNILTESTVFKKTGVDTGDYEHLFSKLVKQIETNPVSTAACESGFT